jgi:ABC-type nitrate/sulfonate/bicarbonate transport system substrate-binding protein
MSILFTRRDCLVAAASLAMSGAASAQGLQEVTIGLSSLSFGTAGARMAKNMGLFEKHGLDAKFVLLETANAATTALISGSLKVSLSGSGELVAAQARGIKVVAIANTFAGLSASIVLAKSVADRLGVKRDAPVAERLKALDGLLIGSTTATSTATVSYRNAARAVGVNLRFSYMAQPAMPAALESGAIQAYSAAAPFWALPVVKGVGVLWIAGPKGELPAEHNPASAGNMQTMRAYAEANPDLVRRLAAVFADLVKAIEERPAAVRAELAKLYPDLDAATLDLLFASEAIGWKAMPLTPADMVKEIEYVKSGGAQLPLIDQIDPKAMLFP